MAQQEASPWGKGRVPSAPGLVEETPPCLQGPVLAGPDLNC